MHSRQELLLLARGDAGRDRVLGHLVESEDDAGHERGSGDRSHAKRCGRLRHRPVTNPPRTSARNQVPAHQPWISLTTKYCTMYSTMIATIGVKSNIPIGGTKRRKILR